MPKPVADDDVAGVAKVAQGGIDRVFRHAALRVPNSWEDKPTMAGQLVQLAEDGDGLVRKGNDVRFGRWVFLGGPPELPSARRDRPARAVGAIEVELRPM